MRTLVGRLWLRVAGILAVIGIAQGQAGAEPTSVKITIFRQYPGTGCTSGYLSVGGTIITYTLERPWVDNMKNVSSVPDGTYSAHLRYDHADHWRIELVGVPNRPNVQIHMGNEPDQTLGCVLVGDGLSASLCSLTGSASAYSKLKRAFYGTDAPSTFDPRDISVTFTGGTKR
jgi:hypothetical protein